MSIFDTIKQRSASPLELFRALVAQGKSREQLAQTQIKVGQRPVPRGVERLWRPDTPTPIQEKITNWGDQLPEQAEREIAQMPGTQAVAIYQAQRQQGRSVSDSLKASMSPLSQGSQLMAQGLRKTEADVILKRSELEKQGIEPRIAQQYAKYGTPQEQLEFQKVNTMGMTEPLQPVKGTIAKVGGKVIKEVGEKIGQKVSGLTDPLLTEARKYKSAEEFVKDIPIFAKENRMERAFVQSPSFGVSGSLGGRMEFIEKSDGIYFREGDVGKFKLSKYQSLDDAVFREKMRSGATEVPKELYGKTSSQLTDIWNQANKAVPEQSLLNEAKKYKSAEEFVKAQDRQMTDVLYRGHSGEIGNNQFFSDYIGHAREYADDGRIDAFYYNPKDVLHIDNNVFDKARKVSVTLKPNELKQIYKDTNYNISKVRKLLDGNKPYNEIITDIEQNNSVIPFLQEYAARKGKNIISFLGSDYAEYGGQMEYVVRDVKRLGPQLTDIWNQANQGENYLYHGTNEDVLANIIKEGLKPSRKGTLSLSMDEMYAKSFAREGMTPQGKTSPVLLRVKADAVKTTPSISGVESDKLNELLTKQTIPPQNVEIFKDDKWQPLTDIWKKAQGVPVPKPMGVPPKPPVEIPKTLLQTAEQIPVPKPLTPKGVDPFAKLRTERGFVETVKRQVPEVGEELQRIAGQYIPRDTDRLAIRAKNLIADDIATAERMAMSGKDDDAVAVASELIKHYNNLAKADKINANSWYQKAADIANTTARNLTESGRTIQAATILGRLTPEGQVRFAAREIQKYNQEIAEQGGGFLGLKKQIPELTDQQAKEIMVDMEKIQKMPDGDERAIAFQQLQRKISDLVPSSLYQKLIGVWKAGLLTGLKTTGVNILSNVSHTGLESIKDIPASAVDVATSLFTNKRTITPIVKGVREGFSEGVVKGWRYLKTGYDVRRVGEKLDFKHVNYGKDKIGRTLQKYTDTVYGLLGAEDQPFYYGAKLRSLYDQAGAEALNRGLKGGDKISFIEKLVQEPTDKMILNATRDAEIAVFQNETTLAKWARQIQKAPGGELIVPFGRTPSAVATQIINYSPVGIAKTIIENVGKGKFDQRLFSQGLGRGLTGTAIIAIGGALMGKGLLNLDRPTGEKEQKLWELEGRQSNTIKIGDKWRSIQILGPAGNLLLIGGHFKRAYETTGSPGEAYAQALAGSAKSFTEQTFVQGLNNLLNALEDPSRAFNTFISGTVASVIPTIISDVARATDTSDKRSKGVLERMMSRIPLLRETLEPKVNVLGGEVQSGNRPLSAGSFLEIMADPTRPTTMTHSPLVMEMRRLFNNGYNITPTLLGDKNGYDSLTPFQNTQLWKRAGQIVESKLTNLMKLDSYWEKADDEKAKVIDNIVSKAQSVARAEAIIEATQDMDGEELKTKLSDFKKSKLMTREVYELYQELK